MVSGATRGTAESSGVVAWANVLRVHAAVLPELDRRMQRRSGLPLTWYDVLLELNGAPERKLTRTELSHRVVVSASRLSRVVDELVGAGYVEREPHPSDGRSSLVRLTGPGRQKLVEAAPGYVADIEALFGQFLQGDEADVIAAGLSRVLRAGRHGDG